MPSAAGVPLSWPLLRLATTARIALGRTGTATPTAAHLGFRLAHARARDAVYAPLDAPGLLAGLAEIGLDALRLRSAAVDRPSYLRRPDLGRRLDADSRRRLMERIGAPAGIVFVIADGLSAAAVNAHAVSLLTVLLARFRDALPAVGPVAVVEGGRVAIGDEIGALLGADLAAVLIGERPGLSAADSLGVYVTWQPAPGTVDAARNCISNVRPQGLPIADAAEALFRLVSGAYCHRLTGVALSRRLADEAVATRPLPAGLNRG
jgi:ethanolamine ammonia-lyase small subunit